jgi:uncharacterized protein (TIGR00730 family)
VPWGWARSLAPLFVVDELSLSLAPIVVEAIYKAVSSRAKSRSLTRKRTHFIKWRSKMKKICVYCASSTKIDKVYFEATEKLAKLFLNENIEVVFGGGAGGLMGKLADTIIENGGKIKGIMPKFMKEIELAHKGVTDFEFTETMHERKTKYLEDIDGLVALPGGSGTLEELLEAITLKRLGLFTKPIVILNTNNYYEPLKDMLNKCVSENFMREKHLKMWTFVNEPEDVIYALKNAPDWNEDAIKFATYK